MNGHNDDELTVNAASFLRGDLPTLPVADAKATDAQIADALALDGVAAKAAAIRALVEDDPVAGPRLHYFERKLRPGTTGEPDIWIRGGYTPPAGDAGPVAVTIWTCPQTPPRHFRRAQLGANQDMGVCTQHDVPLVQEGT